jgi:CDP-diacylglycerol--serine O-phosphatidyltransferase
MRWMRRISVADLLTLLNGALGILAITYILDGRHIIAAILIYFAIMADGLDGFVARKFGTPHEFGRFLDSISDTVSFCLAPALLVYNNFYDPELGSAWTSLPNATIVIACLLYASFGILRLARFAGKDYSKSSFIGLPTPAAAVFVISLSILWGAKNLNALSFEHLPYLVTFATIIISFLMISDIPYPHVRRWLVAPALVLLLLASLPLILEVTLEENPLPVIEIEYAALILMLAYIIFGPVIEHYAPEEKSDVH